MRIVCLMPTFGRRPELIAAAIAMFERQTHDARRLLVLDDLGNVRPQSGDRWEIHTTAARYPSLPAKYTRLLDLAGDDWDALAVWDDDDVYLPWHLAAHAEQLQRFAWSHPATVYGLHDGVPVKEPAAGRFHGALAIRRDALTAVGNWETVLRLQGLDTRRADFDQRMLAALARHRPGGDPCRSLASRCSSCRAGDAIQCDQCRDGWPAYVYGWGRTRHCSAFMASPENTDWYEVHGEVGYREPIDQLTPALDDAAAEMYETLAPHGGAHATG